MDKVNLYEWKTQIIDYFDTNERNRFMYQVLRELYECGFKDVQCIGGDIIYVTGLESNWADFIMTRPDLYDKIIKPERVYYDTK